MIAWTSSNRSSTAAAPRRSGPSGSSRWPRGTRSRSRSRRGRRAGGRCCGRRSSSCSPNGSRTMVSGLSRSSASISWLGTLSGDLAQAVHVVGEADQPGRDGVVGQGAEGGAHHGRCAPPRRRCRCAAGPRRRSRIWNTTGRASAGRVATASPSCRRRSGSRPGRARRRCPGAPSRRGSRLRACSNGQARASRARGDRPESIARA